MPTRAVDVYSIPIGDRFLIYAPRHRLVALVDGRAAEHIRAGLESNATVSQIVAPIVKRLRSSGDEAPVPRSGRLDDPLFLGLITTRGCHLGCLYCDFAASVSGNAVMDVELARDAIDAYLGLLTSCGHRQADIHFFGGEPFDAEDVVHFAVEYATMRAADAGLGTRFEVTTNGVYSATECEWIADHFASVVLSLDGPPEIQDRQRPTIHGSGTFDVVVRSAKILSAGSCELILRACVTDASVSRMQEMARWVSREFVASTVCFETLSETPRSRLADLEPPDPWQFAREFLLASRIFSESGIETVLATADLGACRVSLCPVGRDALIVSPDGSVEACYLPRASWRGLDLRLGEVDGRGLALDLAAVQRVRDLNALDNPLCVDCLLRYHCAGGCRVRHDTNRSPGDYDAMCIQSRVVAFGQLLERVGQRRLADEWLADRSAVEASVWRSSDRLRARVEALPQFGAT